MRSIYPVNGIYSIVVKFYAVSLILCFEFVANATEHHRNLLMKLIF